MPQPIALNFHPPCFKTVFNRVFKLQSIKPTSSSLGFQSSNSVFLRGFFEAAMPTSSSVWCGNGDRGFRSFETEPSFDGSNPEITAAGLEAILNELSKWIVAALFAGVILLRRDGIALWTAVGFVINIVVSLVLKRILNQERPATLRSDPGMPSSHAQSLFFTTFFIIMLVVEWLGVNATSLFVCGLSFIFGSYFSWLRVSQRLHTISQVFVGAVLGGFFSILWYLFWKTVVMEAFTKILWVQVVVLGASMFCVGFFIYILKNSRDDK